MFNLGNMGKLMGLVGKLPQLTSKIDDVTTELKKTMVDGISGDGAVKVTVNAVGQTQSIEIDPTARDNPLLEQWLVEACNQAAAAAKQCFASAASDAARDLDIDMPELQNMITKFSGRA